MNRRDFLGTMTAATMLARQLAWAATPTFSILVSGSPGQLARQHGCSSHRAQKIASVHN